MALKPNEEGRKLGLRAADGKRLDEIFSSLERAKKAVDLLVRCGAEGCDEREEACLTCIQQAEQFRDELFEVIDK